MAPDFCHGDFPFLFHKCLRWLHIYCHASAFPIKELSFTGSGSLGSPIYSLQKNVLQFMSRETQTPTLTITGIMSFASQVAIEFVNRQSNFSEKGHKIQSSKYLSSQPVPLHPSTSRRSVLDEIAQADVKDLLCTFLLSSIRNKGPNSPSPSLTPGPDNISMMWKRPSLFHERILVLQITGAEFERRTFSGVSLSLLWRGKFFMAVMFPCPSAHCVLISF